jgi:hypothetical protein
MSLSFKQRVIMSEKDSKEFLRKYGNSIKLLKQGAIMRGDTITVSVTCRGCDKKFEITVSLQDHAAWVKKEGPKRHAQVAFPYLNADDRELLISQTCGKCWADIFPSEEE